MQSLMLGSKPVIDKSGYRCHEFMFKEELFMLEAYGVAEDQLNVLALNLFYLCLAGVDQLA